MQFYQVMKENRIFDCLFEGNESYWPFIDRYQQEWSPECGGSLP